MRDSQEKTKTKNDILSKFEKSLSDSNYKLEKNYFDPQEGILLDGLITTDHGVPYCVIDIKTELYRPLSPFAKIRVWTYINKTQARFAVITDGNECFFCDVSKGDGDFEELKYDQIIQNIKNLNADSELASYAKSICKYFEENFDFEISEEDINFEDNKKCKIQLDKERTLIEKLFNFEEFPQIVCRYTSLSTLLEMIKNHKIKMYGLAGMNDKSEVDYIESVLSHAIALSNPKMNKLFIMSCSENKKEDDLTLWRLYGNDGKGICLEFEPKENGGALIFRKIKYLNKDSDLIGELKNLVNFVYDLTGYTFVFDTLHEWCHFIKPKEYEIESEVRLLDISPKASHSEWVMANGTNIITPYEEIPFDECPLKLTKIILGPKFPEPDTNLFQLKALIENYGLKDIEVSKSKITNYR